MPILQILVASVRPGRSGPIFADWIAKHAVEHSSFDVQVVDLAEMALPLHDEPHPPATGTYLNAHTIAWSETIKAADAFLFVMPEYNHGYSAPLKNALDYLCKEWRHKPVSFLSYGMRSSGMLAVEQIKPVCNALGMLIAQTALHVSLLNSLDDSGELVVDRGLGAAADSVLGELESLYEAAATLRQPA